MQNYLETILLGLIGSLLFYLLLPLFKKLGFWAITFLSKLSKTFSKYLFIKVSFGYPKEPLLPLIMLFPILLIINVAIYQQVNLTSYLTSETYYTESISFLNNKLRNNRKELNEIESNLTDINKLSINNIKDLLKQKKKGLQELDKAYTKEIISLQQFYEVTIKYEKKSKYIIPILLITVFLLFIIFFIKYLVNDYIVSQNETFNYKLTIARPYLTDDEYYRIKQSWTYIRSAQDIRRINSILDNFIENVDDK